MPGEDSHLPVGARLQAHVGAGLRPPAAGARPRARARAHRL
jgi:hypothetical protein